MTIISVGAWCDHRTRPHTKTVLKMLVEEHSEIVFFERTKPTGAEFPNGKWYLYASDLPEGLTLAVTGRDPITGHSWHATVERTADGLKVT